MEEADETDAVRELRLTKEEIKRRFLDKKFQNQKMFNVASYEADRYNRDFEDAARLCIKLNADPVTFVNCQFPHGIDSTAIVPAFLKTVLAEKNYRSIFTQDLSLEASYKVQIEYLQGQIYRAKRKIENILLDTDIDFSAWFRICISTIPIPSVIDVYGSEAREEMKSNPKLKKFLEEKNLDYKRITND